MRKSFYKIISVFLAKQILFEFFQNKRHIVAWAGANKNCRDLPHEPVKSGRHRIPPLSSIRVMLDEPLLLACGLGSSSERQPDR